VIEFSDMNEAGVRAVPCRCRIGYISLASLRPLWTVASKTHLRVFFPCSVGEQCVSQHWLAAACSYGISLQIITSKKRYCKEKKKEKLQFSEMSTDGKFKHGLLKTQRSFGCRRSTVIENSAQQLRAGT